MGLSSKQVHILHAEDNKEVLNPVKKVSWRLLTKNAAGTYY